MDTGKHVLPSLINPPLWVIVKNMKRNLIPLGTMVFLILLGGCPVQQRPDIPAVESRIREICEIPGYEHVYRDIIYIDEKTSFLAIPVVDKRLLFAVDVRVKAGIDLHEGFSVEKISRKAVRVTLPPAEVLLADADEESIHQYFLKEFGGQVSRLEYYDEIERKKKELITDAIQRGILIRAEANVRKVIENFILLSGYDTVIFQRTAQEGPVNG